VLEEETGAREEEEGYVANVGAGAYPAAGLPAHLRAGVGDPVFFLLAFVAVATSAAFTSMVAVAIPTMLAMRRAANSFTLLADAALEELPSTMAAVRLSGMEISDLTLELSDLRYEHSLNGLVIQKRERLSSIVSSSICFVRVNDLPIKYAVPKNFRFLQIFYLKQFVCPFHWHVTV
jgi:hypothetical protein